jgi:hypothetical protein
MSTTTDPREGWTSASNALPDSLCPGRHLAQRGLPEETNEDADAGTRMHAAVATGNMDGLTSDEQDLVERVIEERLKISNAWLVGKALNEVLIDEQRLWLTDPDSGFSHSGQPDYAVFAESKAGVEVLICDWKFGRIAVEDPAENAQLRDLVVLADARAGGELLQATVQIIQPFAGRFTPTLYGEEDIMLAGEALMARIRRSNDPKSLRVAGEAQCKYCRARTRCPEFEAWATAPLPKPLTKPAVAEVIAQADTLLPAISNDKLVAMLDVAGLAEKWFALLRSEARARLKHVPDCLPGWELKPGVTRSAITDIEAVWRRWEAAYPACTREFVSVLKASKKDLESAVRGITGFKGKAVKEVLEGLIAGATTETITSPRLVRAGEEDEQ